MWGLTPPLLPPLQLFLRSLALSQEWFADFFLTFFVGLPCSTRLLFLQNQRKSRHPGDWKIGFCINSERNLGEVVQKSGWHVADLHNDGPGGRGVFYIYIYIYINSKWNLNICVSPSFKTLSDLVLWQGWECEGEDKAAGIEETFY